MSVFGLLAACGSLGDVGERAPLAVLDGQLTQAATVAPASASNVRISVVWMSIDESGYKVSQDIPATPVFPSSFHLVLTDPPPRAAMATAASQGPSEPSDPPSVGGSGSGGATPPDPGPAPSPRPASLRPADHKERAAWPASFGVAIGAVVAYEDTNGNGVLDLVDDSATSYVDRVLGVNEELLLVYIEGTAPEELRDGAGNLPGGGYHLLKKPTCVATATQDTLNRGSTPAVGPNDPGGQASEPVPMPSRVESCDSNVTWLPMTTLYNLPLTAEPRFGSLMCKGRGGLGFGEGDSAGISSGEAYMPGQTLPPGPGPDGFPAKSDPNLSCTSDGKAYSFQKCSSYSQGLCKGTITECSSKMWGLPAGAVPADWPCTIK